MRKTVGDNLVWPPEVRPTLNPDTKKPSAILWRKSWSLPRSIPLHLPDATGITPTANLIEQIGVQRSRAAESAAVIAVANKTLDTHL